MNTIFHLAIAVLFLLILAAFIYGRSYELKRQVKRRKEFFDSIHEPFEHAR